jgi:hypothetical protein
VWYDDDTLATPGRVGVITPLSRDARVVLRSDMRAGQTADIPPSVGVLRVRFEAGLTLRRLILVVGLWEEDETPQAAMLAGFHAFSGELRAAFADHILELTFRTPEEKVDEIITDTILPRVSGEALLVIWDSLKGWQRARWMVGALNLDDEVGRIAFERVRDIAPRPINLAFGFGQSDPNRYELEGRLMVRRVLADRCQAQADAVKAAQAVVDDIDAQIKQLQEELNNAPPPEKPFINSEIKRLREQELAAAMADVEAARRALAACRARSVPTHTFEQAPG